jgi:hypothetical protein
MVLNIGNSDNEEDTTEGHGIFDAPIENVIDSDMSDIVQGPVMNNPRITSLFSTQRGWKVLRLPGARVGDEGTSGLRNLTGFMLQFVPGWRGQTIRDSPFRQMVTARMWQSYINNMEAIDDALELQAAYSPEELISLRAFCEEWSGIDPGHIAFTRRLSQHPSTHASDAVLKGNMVYDLCTGQIQLRTSRGVRGESNIPIRLAHDILTSIPFAEYNYYTLNSVHAQEGAQVYSDFLNRYIRLTATEVATVEEIESGVRASGRGYATISTNITGDPIEAFALMQQTVEAMDMGDTLTVRANINALLSPPYNFRSGAQQINVSGPHGGNFVAMDDLIFIKFDPAKKADKWKEGKPKMMYKQGRDKDGKAVKLKAQAKDAPEGFYMEVNDNGRGIKQVWEFLKVGGTLAVRAVDYDEQALQVNAMIGGFNRVDQAAKDERAPGGDPERQSVDRRRGLRGTEGPRGNPGVRENFFGKKEKIDPVPKTDAKQWAIIYNKDSESQWMKYFLLMNLGTKNKAWVKKNKNDLFNPLLEDLLMIRSYKKVLPKREIEVIEAFLDGGHKFDNKNGTYVTIADSAAMSYDNKILDEPLTKKLLTKGNDLYNYFREVRSNPSSARGMFNGTPVEITKVRSVNVERGRWGSSSTMARGKYIYVEILPKTRIEFKGKHKTSGKQGGKQFWLQGSTGISDPTGLGKVLPGGVGEGYFIKKAIETRTQTAQPWLIAIPRADFQSFTDSQGRRTIRPKRRKAELNPAWEKFLKFYGVPTYKGGSAGKANLHGIKAADRGKFYDTLRSKPTVKE